MPKDTLTGRVLLLEQSVQGLLMREPSGPTISDRLLERIAHSLEVAVGKSPSDRDRIAEQVMLGMLSGINLSSLPMRGIGPDEARVAYDAADALIKEGELRRARFSYLGKSQVENQTKE